MVVFQGKEPYMKDNHKQLIVVTGATRGIGRAITENFISLGYSVIGLYVDSSDEAQKLEKKYSSLIMKRVDVSDSEEVSEFIYSLRSQKIYALVNNAGCFEEESIDGYDLSKWHRSIDTNVTGPVQLITGLFPNICEGGSIVNIASIDAYYAGYASVSYPASKAALISVTKSFAALLASKGIRVNAIAPGWIDTDMGSGASGVTERAMSKTPLGRNGTSREVSDLVQFLVSETASFITGQTINIDGGYSIVDEVLKLEHENLKHSQE